MEMNQTIDQCGDDANDDNCCMDSSTLLAEQVAKVMDIEFGSIVSGVHIIDQLYGYNNNHNLVDAFGFQDGIWQHSSWCIIPQLQQQIHSIQELRTLLHTLGRRPTVQTNSKMYHFPPRRLQSDGCMGAQLDINTRSTLYGLTLSNSITEMLPSEALLLIRSSSGSSAHTLRQLFWAKLIESKLLSYEYIGYTDIPSIPQQRKKRQRLPSGLGGPIIVCLDTSWSMSGHREWLSKAVVLASVAAAHRQGRTCHVVAFSQGVMDGGELSATPEGLHRLLEFLSHSFVGGTDISAALRYTMDTLLSENHGTEVSSSADVLLITDGEIPEVKQEIIHDLDRLKQRLGIQVHGLLVGQRDSAAMEQLCTHTHNFLMNYDIQNLIPTSKEHNSSPTALAYHRTQQDTTLQCRDRNRFIATNKVYLSRPKTIPLFARSSFTSRAGGRGKRRFDDDDDFYFDSPTLDNIDNNNNNNRIVESGEFVEATSSRDSFESLVDQTVQRIREAVSLSIEEESWQMSELDLEQNSKDSCWQYRDQFRQAVAQVSSNLIERDEESRLVVLGLVAGEHVFFLGPPGTAKSALGRRLATICGGGFFQRLLTRFTTPEELFGPLSLRALERDEYVRQTNGYLPTATIAFLDEIFKANSAILNTLLTILNERTFDNGAGHREDCPIRCVIAASNELPESDELDALFDRFLLRKEIQPVSDDGIMQLVSQIVPKLSHWKNRTTTSLPTERDSSLTDDLEKIVQALSLAADDVHVGHDTSALLRDLRNFMRQEFNVNLSDRRLVQAARLLRISAASHGRRAVDPIDCLLLQHVAWRSPEQRTLIRDWLWDRITPGSVGSSSSSDGGVVTNSNISQFQLLLNNLRQECIQSVRKTNGDVTGSMGGRDVDIAVLTSLCMEIQQIALQLQQQRCRLCRHIELLRKSSDHLWLDVDEARAAQQLLLPKADIAVRDTVRVLNHAQALIAVLGENVSNEVRLSVLEQLWDDDDDSGEMQFSVEELSIGMKEAKTRYDAETFRKWKRARKKGSQT